MFYAVVAEFLAVWLVLAVWLRRTVLWVILAGFLFLLVLLVGVGILNSAAGPAAMESSYGNQAEARAHGRGTMADLALVLFGVVILGFPMWLFVALGVVFYLVVDAVLVRRGR